MVRYQHLNIKQTISRESVYLVILTDRDQRSRSIQTISEEEECEQVDERVGEALVLFCGFEYLFPTDSEVVAPFGDGRPWTGLLEYD